MSTFVAEWVRQAVAADPLLLPALLFLAVVGLAIAGMVAEAWRVWR